MSKRQLKSSSTSRRIRHAASTVGLISLVACGAPEGGSTDRSPSSSSDRTATPKSEELRLSGHAALSAGGQSSTGDTPRASSPQLDVDDERHEAHHEQEDEAQCARGSTPRNPAYCQVNGSCRSRPGFTFSDTSTLTIKSRDRDHHPLGTARTIDIELTNVGKEVIDLRDVALTYSFTDSALEFDNRVLFLSLQAPDLHHPAFELLSPRDVTLVVKPILANLLQGSTTGNRELQMTFSAVCLPPGAVAELALVSRRSDHKRIDETADPSYLATGTFLPNPAIRAGFAISSTLEDAFGRALRALGGDPATESFAGTRLSRFPLLDKTVFSRKYLRATRPPLLVNLDAQGNAQDPEALELAERRAALQRYGALSPQLFARVQSARGDFDAIPVLLNLDLSGVPYVPPSVITSQNVPADMEAWAVANEAALRARNVPIATKMSLVVDQIRAAIATPGWAPAGFDARIRSDVALGMISVNLTKKILQQRDLFPAVSLVVEGDGNAGTDLWSAAYRMNVDNLHAHGFEGAGITAAVWEGASPNFTDQMAIDVARVDSSAFAALDQHVAYMLAAIKNARTKKTDPLAPTSYGGTGFAPASRLLLANYSGNAEMFTALQWAAEQGASVVNQSWHTVDSFGTVTQGGNTYGFDSENSGDDTFDDRFIDLIASLYPFPTICQAAGNIDRAVEYVNHKGYNTIVVGQDQRDGYAMVSTSASLNPLSRQELPHVTAAVSTTSGVSMWENPDGTSVVTRNGATSLASAMTSGFVASLQSMNPALLRYAPWAVRAIAMASADNIEGTTWSPDPQQDQRDGAGRLNGINAWLIASNPYTSGPAAEHGFFIDQIPSGNSYTKTIALMPRNSGNLRIALSWFASVNTANYVSTLSDLDLELVGPAGTLESASLVNPVEMIVINNAVAGQQYWINIKTAKPVTYATNFGVAWVNR